MNKMLRCLTVLAALIAVAGCSTPASRIRSHQAAYDTWPAATQQEVSAGRIGVGFTQEMVLVALGEADRRYTRTTERGSSEIWMYLDHGPKFSIGLGIGGVSGHTAMGGGLVVGDEAFRDNELLRVIFDGGKVSGIEARRK